MRDAETGEDRKSGFPAIYKGNTVLMLREIPELNGLEWKNLLYDRERKLADGN